MEELVRVGVRVRARVPGGDDGVVYGEVDAVPVP